MTDVAEDKRLAELGGISARIRDMNTELQALYDRRTDLFDTLRAAGIPFRQLEEASGVAKESIMRRLAHHRAKAAAS